MTLENMTDYFTFLDGLRESGKTNMYGARPYLVREFSELAADRGAEGGKVLSAWMRTFDPDVAAADRAKTALTTA